MIATFPLTTQDGQIDYIMLTTALLDLEGLPCRMIHELSFCEREQRVRGRFAGEVLKSTHDEKFTSLKVSDGTATAEVSLVYRKLKCQQLVPQRGESVQIIGHGYKKILGGKNEYFFLKILALSVSVVSIEEELEINLQAVKSFNERNVQRLSRIEQTEKIKPLYTRKSFETVSQQLEIRTLIMTFCYYVFENNSDIQSYIFNPEMIRCSRHGREFMQNFGITKDCLQQILRKTLIELISSGLLLQKMMIEKEKKQQFFLIKRDIFRGIEKTLQQRIIEFGSKGGVNIEQLTSHANRRICQFTNATYNIFNWKFLQGVLRKLQGINKIYKTSDKLIFPNIR